MTRRPTSTVTVQERIAQAKADWQNASDLIAIRQSFETLCQGGKPNPPSTARQIAGLDTECFRADLGSMPALYLHGGGFQIGSTQSHGNLIDAIASAAQRPVIAVNYRLAPEHRYPAALDDVFAVYAELTEAAEGIPIVGDSAGAGLALALFQKARSAGLPLPPKLVLISPWLDLELSGPSYIDLIEADIFSTPETLAAMARTYVGKGGRLDDPLVSPLHMDMDRLPSTLIHAGGADITRSDSEFFEERAAALGVDITLRVWSGMFHHFQMFTDLPQSRESLDEIGKFLTPAPHTA